MGSSFVMLVSCFLLLIFPLSIPCLAGMKKPNRNGGAVEAEAEALFVFGDSYADTGNHEPLDSVVNKPWKRPYGFTWPGRPSGRFSNGRVLTDFFAAHLGIETPLPYRVIQKKVREHGNNRHVREVAARGINFAYGGSGVFPTFGAVYPTISTQIGQLRSCVGEGLVSLSSSSSSSIALLVVAGNDYTVYGILHPDEKGIYYFIGKVVAEIVNSIELLYELGFKSVAVTNLEPFGCFPGVTYLSHYTSCNKTENQQSSYHNKLLATQVSKLQARLPNFDVMILDLEHAFLLALQGNFSNTRSQWKSCCKASKKGNCGDVDAEGRPLYRVCSKPQRSLYWDAVHPTDFGWKCVSQFLFSS